MNGEDGKKPLTLERVEKWCAQNGYAIRRALAIELSTEDYLDQILGGKP